MKISSITVCKNRLDDLKVTLPRLVTAGVDEVILVDYNCPQHCGRWAEEHYPSVKVVRQADDLDFNISRARNLGAQASSSEWLLFIDADVIASAELLQFMRDRNSPGCFFRTERQSGTRPRAWGALAVERTSFDRVGGYDEVFVGWGCEDDDIFYKLAINGVRETPYPITLVDEIRTPDDKRVEYSPLKSRLLQHALNLVYLQSKKLIWASGFDMSEIPMDIRKELYSLIRSKLPSIIESYKGSSPNCEIKIRLAERPLPFFRPMVGTQELLMKFSIEFKKPEE